MRSCRICSFFLFCFLSTTSGLGEVKDEVGGGGAPLIRNESISLPNNKFELQKDKQKIFLIFAR